MELPNVPIRCAPPSSSDYEFMPTYDKTDFPIIGCAKMKILKLVCCYLRRSCCEMAVTAICIVCNFLQDGEEVVCVHLDRGILIRLDDHQNMLLAMKCLLLLLRATSRGSMHETMQHVQFLMKREMPGVLVKSMGEVVMFIYDLGGRALWPGLTLNVAVNPHGIGGDNVVPEFTKVRYEVLAGESSKKSKFRL